MALIADAKMEFNYWNADTAKSNSPESQNGYFTLD